MVSITVNSFKSHMNYIWVSSYINKNVWVMWLCVSKSQEVQLYLWMLWRGNILLLTVKYFGVAMVTALTSLSFLISRNLSFSIVSLKYLLSLLYHCNLVRKFLYVTSRIDRMHALVPHKSCPSCRHFHHQLVHAHTENNITPASSSCYTRCHL
jgi:hypothetical protein